MGKLSGEPAGPIGVMLIAGAILIPAILVLRRMDSTGHFNPGNLFVCVAVLVSMYHLPYDQLLLLAPLLGMLKPDPLSTWSVMKPTWRYLGIGLAVVVLCNYVATWTVLARIENGGPLWWLITLINPTAVLLLYCLWTWSGWNTPHAAKHYVS